MRETSNHDFGGSHKNMNCAFPLIMKVISLRKIKVTMKTCSVILQPLQIEPEQKKKRVLMRAMRKKLQKQSFADILQNRCS